MKTIKYYILSFFVIALMNSCSQLKKGNEKFEYIDNCSNKVIDNFFHTISLGNYNQAIEDLLNENNNIDPKDSATINLKKQFNDINETSGKYIQYKPLRKKNLNNDLGIYCYLVKYDKKFYRFLFTFYNNESNVKIYKFSFDDNLDVELEESLKLYIN